MLGRQDLLETQLRGAITNGELTAAQLRELAYQLHPYAGWGNGTNLLFVTEKLVAEMTAQQRRRWHRATSPCSRYASLTRDELAVLVPRAAARSAS